MYDKTLIAHLLPPEMIIKNFIHGDPDCNYEKYLLEFVNSSTFFLAKSGGITYHCPESEESGQCDCISTRYQLDFKLIASKTALQASQNWMQRFLTFVRYHGCSQRSREFISLEIESYRFQR